MEGMGKLKVAAYCRVSTDKEDQANSLQSQRRYFTEYIASNPDWKLTEVYFDEGISGTQTKKRAGYNRMIEAAMCGEIDLILTKEVSRFARNTVDTLSYTRKLKEKGVGVVFTLDGIDTRAADGELRLTIMASIAQEESRKTSERVKWGQKRRMEAGVVFGRDLLGYQVQKGKLRIREEEAEIVRAIFYKYTNEGKGASVIARELQKEGIYPMKAGAWSNVVILRILRNEKYAGDLCQKKTITPDYLTHKKKYNHGEEEMIYIKDHHEPIIDRSLWERTQSELLRRTMAVKERKKYSSRYWCSGKLCCGECGSGYVSRVKKRSDGSCSRSWRCHAAARYGAARVGTDGGSAGCSNGSVNEQSLLAAVTACLNRLPINRAELNREILGEISRLKKKETGPVPIQKIETEIQRLQNKKRRAVDLVLEGVIAEEELRQQLEWYKNELERCEEKKRSLQEGLEAGLHPSEPLEVYRSALEELLDPDIPQERIFREAVDRIVICKDHILKIWFRGIPSGFRVKIRAHGRKHYVTDILEIHDMKA